MQGGVLLREAVTKLREAGIASAAGDARRLLAHALRVSPERLTLALHDPVAEEAQARFARFLAARMDFQPVSQITGARLFWGRKFKVTQDTLDPRPETEILVERALQQPFRNVLDLGTGTGCILLSCLAEMPKATGVGVDLSPQALAVAQSNADNLGLSERVRLTVSDWFDAVDGMFDLIVSNPPYIAQDEMAGLARDVLDWEPHSALTPGGDGLSAYAKIARGLLVHLAPGGRILFEIGPTQGAAVCGFLSEIGLDGCRIWPDLDGRDRVVEARRPL
ncbi:peptide chain release factor N(5)-glutamine methyltransferase [Thioclava sp. GXIMD4216]|uniref:Release factor glutamine methyltransferase n=1 Tax=Thioclava litoralis TaxID=3076557 RepID=A0ABZ1E125_9RHOB|nr:peptide chain release factor N(5)-glutamine methyltransferase [Thioclava sp. FTW29]